MTATSGQLRERLFDLAAETDRRVQLLERALEQLGGSPEDAASAASGTVRLAPALADGQHEVRHLLEGLLLFEIRDEIIGDTIVAMARESPDPRVSEVLELAALPIESNEAFGAHDSPRHRERIEFLHASLRGSVRSAVGLDPG